MSAAAKLESEAGPNTDPQMPSQGSPANFSATATASACLSASHRLVDRTSRLG